MTQEEAAKVKVGDILITKIGKEFAPVEVVEIVCESSWSAEQHRYADPSKPYLFKVIRKGTPRADRLGNPTTKTLSRPIQLVNWAPEALCQRDPVQANVFADWLDDHDFPEAATALRAAFPLGLPEETQA